MAGIGVFLSVVAILVTSLAPVQSGILKSSNDSKQVATYDMDIGPGPGTQLMFSDNRIKIGAPLFAHTEDVVFRGFTITRIIVRNIATPTATATLVAGGPGYKHATIRLTSARSEGYNFVINMYTN